MPNTQDETFNSWNRQPNEPDVWFDRFDKYGRPQGYEFKVKVAYLIWVKETHKTEATLEDLQVWNTYAVEWKWEARAREWAEFDRIQTANMWFERKKQLLEQDWQSSNELRNVATRFLEVISLTQIVGEDESGNKLLKVAIKPSELAQILKTASDLGRLGVGEPTSISATAKPGVGIYLPQVDKEKRDEQG